MKSKPENIVCLTNKICRVILGTQCNLSCSYCCNKIPSVQESFKMTTMDILVKMKYDIFNLSGGEITLMPEKLKQVVFQIRKYNPMSKIYLYSNGYNPKILRDMYLYESVDGISLGIHENNVSLGIKCLNYLNSEGIYPRVLIFDSWRNWDIEFSDLHYLNVIPKHLRVELVKDSCDNINEDRYII